MVTLREDLVNASQEFLRCADMNIGVSSTDAALVSQMITAQMNLIDDISFIIGPNVPT